VGILDRFRREKPVTAAAVRSVSPDALPPSSPYSREAGEAWKAYRCLGEVGYIVNQQARLVGRLDWTISINGAEPLDTEKSDLMLRAAFGDNLEDLATKAAQCIQVPGGYYLARTRPNDANSWRILSAPLSAKNKKAAEASDVLVYVRTEDPEDDSRNDSPTLRAMDTCRELILTRAQARAQARSRTAQHGFLVYATEGVKDPTTFEADLIDVMTAPLMDEQSVSAVAPNIIGMPKDYIESLKALKLDDGYDEKLVEKDAVLVRRLAVQMDAPPEILTGFSDTNHWSGWAIQEDNWLGHVEPMAKPIGAGFAEAIMRVVEGSDVKIEPDPGPLLQRRPAVADVANAYENQVVSGEYYREVLGADETDAPTPAEIATRAPVEQAPAGGEPPTPAAIAASLRSILPDTPELAVVAAPRKGPDPVLLAAIDTQVYDAVEDLVNDTASRVIDRLGAKVRRMAAASRTAVPEGATDADLALAYVGPIPNADALVTETIAESLPRLDRAVGRAYSRLRSAGVEASLDPDDEMTARGLYSTLVAGVVATRLAAKPTDAAAWQASRRVVAVAGGNADPGAATRAAS
jgi:hypothetical protein